jgi:creatinine amidohydrolase
LLSIYPQEDIMTQDAISLIMPGHTPSVQEVTMKVLLAEMTRPEVEERLRPNTLAVLPVASTEQHGPHLPLATDALIVGECARRAAERVAEEMPIVVAPTLAFGFSPHHMDFAGTLSLSVPTYIAALTELSQSLIQHGFRKLLLLNGHGGNHELIQVVVRQVVARHKVVAAAASYWDVARADLEAAGSAEVGLVPGHSAGFETSCLLALRPDLVDLGRLPTDDQSQPRDTDARRTVKGMGVMVVPHASQHGASGVWGDPALVRADLGPAFLEAITAAVARLYLALSRTEGY